MEEYLLLVYNYCIHAQCLYFFCPYQVYLVLPLYMRFAGSIVCCLRKWLDTTEEIDPSDNSYWTPPSNDKETDQQVQHDEIDPAFKIFSLEMLSGSPEGPMHLVGWNHGDPRFCDPRNPLYNLKASKRSDWSDNVDITKLRQFYDYVKSTSQNNGSNNVGDAKEIKVKVDASTGTDPIDEIADNNSVDAATPTPTSGKKKRNRNKKKKKGGQSETTVASSTALAISESQQKDQPPSTNLLVSSSCNAHGDTSSGASPISDSPRRTPCTHGICQMHCRTCQS